MGKRLAAITGRPPPSWWHTPLATELKSAITGKPVFCCWILHGRSKGCAFGKGLSLAPPLPHARE